MSKGGSAGGSGDGTEILIFLAMIIAIPFMLWFLLRFQMLSFFFTASPPVFEFAYEWRNWLLLTDNEVQQMKTLYNDIAHKNTKPYGKEPFNGVTSFFEVWGAIFRIPVFLICAFLAWTIYRNPAVSEKYVGQISLDTWARAIATVYPFTLPALNAKLLDNTDYSFNNGWRVPLSCIEGCAHFGLLQKKGVDLPAIPFTTFYHYSLQKRREALGDYQYITLNSTKVDRYFTSQLGKKFTGIDNLDKYERALAITFMAYACGGKLKETSYKLLKQFSRTFVDKANNDLSYLKKPKSERFNMDFGGVEEAYASVKGHEKYADIQRVMDNHCYEKCVIAGLLARRLGGARIKGKLPPSHFLWMRPYDPQLYSFLNCMGGQEPFFEARGCWAHYHAEFESGIKLEDPCIQGATDSLVKILFDEKWIHDEVLTNVKIKEDMEFTRQLQMIEKALDETDSNQAVIFGMGSAKSDGSSKKSRGKSE